MTQPLPEPNPAPASEVRVRLDLRGLVQGVGFRPFIHRQATALGLAGFVQNTPSGARLEIQGTPQHVETFQDRLHHDAPPPCQVWHVEATRLPPLPSARGFEIRSSSLVGPRHGIPLPDLATCDACRAEIFSPQNRRYRYPFTNCTACGPRFSILESLPYDRSRTVMRHFALCPECRAEYEDPSDRRFHAEPVACPTCGPRLSMASSDGRILAVRDEALVATVDALREGRIVALKGLGGFQLLVRADSSEAVALLRSRKQREAKPLALMVPSVEHARGLCRVASAEERLLRSSAAPIVLLRRRPDPEARIADEVAPDHLDLGIMLPCTPLHHLLLADLGLPVVATSGNLSDEPLCIDNAEAIRRLGNIADAFLLHDRTIARPIDDSVARVILGQEQVLRRARGYAPLPLPCPHFGPPCPTASPPSLLALGGQLKGAIAVARDDDIFLGPHLGDLETELTVGAFEQALRDLPDLLDSPPERVVVDRHPDYYATQRAESLALPILRVQHHEAHAWSCLADNGLLPPALALSWDGTGLGADQTIWGGEALELQSDGCRRRAWFRPFPLPGGDAASRDIRRSLLGLLHEGGWLDTPEIRPWLTRLFSPTDLTTLRRALARGVQAPRTSSVGRLFDAVAALLGLADVSRFEGEAARRVEVAAESAPVDPSPPLPPPASLGNGLSDLDWRPWFATVLSRLGRVPAPVLAREFHEFLAMSALAVAESVRIPRILLTGGCFQNRLLTERVAHRLGARGFSVYVHQRIPPNDGGLACGQIVAARCSIHDHPAPPASSPIPPCASPSQDAS